MGRQWEGCVHSAIRHDAHIEAQHPISEDRMLRLLTAGNVFFDTCCTRQIKLI